MAILVWYQGDPSRHRPKAPLRPRHHRQNQCRQCKDASKGTRTAPIWLVPLWHCQAMFA